jgi:general secretion pathway protein H
MRQRGFTLVEILVAMVIIGLMIVGVLVSVTMARGDRELETERDRILALTDHLRDQAALQAREYGLRVYRGGHQFLYYDPRTGLWQDQGDDLLRPRELPEEVTVRLAVDGRDVVLPDEDVDPDQRAPQILLYSTGELSLFELDLRRGRNGEGVRIAPAEGTDHIEALKLEASAR